MIKAIAFDVDDTLYDLAQPFYRAYEEMTKGKYDVPVDEIFTRSRRYSDKIYHHYTSGKWTLDQVGSYRVCHAFADYGVELTEEEGVAFQRCYLKYQQEIFISDVMEKVLDELQGKVKLGLLTNGVSEHQHRKLRVLNLSRWIPIEHQVVSGDYGIHKPDPRIFQLLAEKMGCATDEILFVGDAYVNDITGAKGANCKTLWFNRRNHPVPEDDQVVDSMVNTEEELLAELKNRFK